MSTTRGKGTSAPKGRAKAAPPPKRAAPATKAAAKAGQAAKTAGLLSAARVIASKMPGWKIVSAPLAKITLSDQDSRMKIEHGPSIAQLGAKFFGDEKVADSIGKAGDTFSPVDTSVKTVRIAPKTGGPAKTADIKDGKVSIVQG